MRWTTLTPLALIIAICMTKMKGTHLTVWIERGVKPKPGNKY